MHDNQLKSNATEQIKQMSKLIADGQEVIEVKSNVWVDDTDNLHNQLTVQTMSTELNNTDVANLFKQNEGASEPDPDFDINKDIDEPANKNNHDKRLSQGDKYRAILSTDSGQTAFDFYATDDNSARKIVKKELEESDVAGIQLDTIYKLGDEATNIDSSNKVATKFYDYLATFRLPDRSEFDYPVKATDDSEAFSLAKIYAHQHKDDGAKLLRVKKSDK